MDKHNKLIGIYKKTLDDMCSRASDEELSVLYDVVYMHKNKRGII